MRRVRYGQESRRPPSPMGGEVIVIEGRDRVDGSAFFVVTHERCQCAAWHSSRLLSREHADIAALVLGEFANAKVK